MATRKTIKLIKSLHQKKYRYQHRLFLVEGAKSVLELFATATFTLKTLLGTKVFLQQHKNLFIQQLTDDQIFEVDEATLSGLGYFKNNNAAVAVVAFPTVSPVLPTADEYVLALDTISDPGNLGTILRVADWYGINQIVCSPETTDVYAPKVISASMGSFLRVRVQYDSLSAYLEQAALPVYGAALNRGDNIHQLSPDRPGGIILLGNESVGINPNLNAFISHYIHIPRYGRAESLNVGVATAIVCDNLRRIGSREENK